MGTCSISANSARYGAAVNTETAFAFQLLDVHAPLTALDKHYWPNALNTEPYVLWLCVAQGSWYCIGRCQQTYTQQGTTQLHTEIPSVCLGPNGSCRLFDGYELYGILNDPDIMSTASFQVTKNFARKKEDIVPCYKCVIEKSPMKFLPVVSNPSHVEQIEGLKN